METCIVSSPPQQRDWTELGHSCGRAVQSIPNFANEMTIDGVLPLSSSVTVAESGADGMNPCVTLNPHHTHTYTHTHRGHVNARCLDQMWRDEQKDIRVWFFCLKIRAGFSGCTLRYFLGVQNVFFFFGGGEASLRSSSPRAHAHGESCVNHRSTRWKTRITNSLWGLVWSATHTRGGCSVVWDSLAVPIALLSQTIKNVGPTW